MQVLECFAIFLVFLYFQCCCHRCLVCPQWDISIGQKGKKWTRDAKFRDLTSCLFISSHNPGNSANFTTLHSALIARRASSSNSALPTNNRKIWHFSSSSGNIFPAGALRHNSRNLWSTHNKVKQDDEIREWTRRDCTDMTTLKASTARQLFLPHQKYQIFRCSRNKLE